MTLPELLRQGETRYLVGHDTLGSWDGSEWAYHLPDALGSVRQELVLSEAEGTDAAGAVVSAREWTPFGVAVGAAQMGLGYTGEWFDADVGLEYLRARWYQPGTGRFMRRDPLEGILQRPDTQHRYTYAAANPVNFSDPRGLWYGPDQYDPAEAETFGERMEFYTMRCRLFLGACVQYGTPVPVQGCQYKPRPVQSLDKCLLLQLSEYTVHNLSAVPGQDRVMEYTRMISDEARRYDLNTQELAYVLATVHWESHFGYWMEEIASGEAYDPPSTIATRLGNTQPGDGPRFKGRGFVQLTGRDNYQYYTDLFGLDLINEPTLASDPGIATQILIHGMTTGSYTGKRLSDFSDGGGYDFVAARAIINAPSSHPGDIADIAEDYLTILQNECTISGSQPP